MSSFGGMVTFILKGGKAKTADFLKRLSTMKKAKEFFDTLNKANTYAIAWRLQTAKRPETREKRLKAILSMLAKKEKFHD